MTKVRNIYEILIVDRSEKKIPFKLLISYIGNALMENNWWNIELKLIALIALWLFMVVQNKKRINHHFNEQKGTKFNYGQIYEH